MIIDFLTNNTKNSTGYVVITDEVRYSRQRRCVGGDYSPSYNIHPSGLYKSTWGTGKSPRGQTIHATKVGLNYPICSENSKKKPTWNDVETNQDPNCVNCLKCLKKIQQQNLVPACYIEVFS